MNNTGFREGQDPPLQSSDIRTVKKMCFSGRYSIDLYKLCHRLNNSSAGRISLPLCGNITYEANITRLRANITFTFAECKKEDPGYCHWDSHKMQAFYGSPFYWIDFGQVNCPKSTPKALSDPGNPSSMQKRRPRLLPGSSRWRSRRDSNPRYAHHVHTISNRARYGHFDTAPYLLGLFS